MAKQNKNQPNRKNYYRYGATIVDENGLAIRVLPSKHAALNWLDKHFPGMDPSEKNKRIWRFNSKANVRKFLNKQFDMGLNDRDVIGMLSFYEGTITRHGLDLKMGRYLKSFKD
jgi:hypothetical protein